MDDTVALDGLLYRHLLPDRMGTMNGLCFYKYVSLPFDCEETLGLPLQIQLETSLTANTTTTLDYEIEPRVL